MLVKLWEHRQKYPRALGSITNRKRWGECFWLEHTATAKVLFSGWCWHEIFPHHLKQSPQQETHANIRRAGEVELVAQSWSKDKVVHVYRDGEDAKIKHIKQRQWNMVETLSIKLHKNTRRVYLGTSDGEVARVTHLTVAFEMLCGRTFGRIHTQTNETK